MEKIKKYYQIKNEVEVANFLKENDFLTEIIIEKGEKIKETFGDVKVSLEKTVDEKSECLMAIISTANCYNEIFKKIKKLEVENIMDKFNISIINSME